MRSLQAENHKFTTTCSCENPIECLRHMFVEMTQKRRVEKEGQCPARRPVFLRTHGILRGQLRFLDTIPLGYRHGLFDNGGEIHPVYVRYSSDLSDGRPDWMSTIGVGIKIFDIRGEKVVSDDGANTADFLLQNVPFFFVDNARDMCEFTKASFEGWGDEWVREHSPSTNALLDQMAKPIRSVFDTQMWSVVPFRLGEGYCKYMLRPGSSTFAMDPDINDPCFLGKDLAARLLAGPATLDMYIQKRPEPGTFSQTYIDEHFPLDQATVIWDEKAAPPVKVATIELPSQDIKQLEQEVYGDWLAFNIGRVPKGNEPVGSIAEARMSIYQTSANYRRETNGQPTPEPSEPGQPEIQNPQCPFPHHPAQEQPKALTKEQIEQITHVRIHPGIGVARLGNSTSEYAIGPEVLHPKQTEFGATRDAGGAIKRQAARFRVYGYDKYGNVVAEIHQSSNSSIEWSVHVANRKAQWYEFNAAMDIPATKNISVPLRNPDVKGSGRAALCIDPGEKKIMGISMNDSSYVLTGAFQGTTVTLGELRTDAVGRLLFLPGFGVSGSPSQQPVYNPAVPSSFNNASGWYDDMSDGPVRARVILGDCEYEADAAWVTAAPPNYAPDLTGFRNLDDLLRGVYIESGLLEVPNRVSFQEHVRPILERLNKLQWVNKGFLALYGAGAPMNFSDPQLMDKLGTPPESSLYPDPYAELRRVVYNSFRTTTGTTPAMSAWPPMYGDTFGYSDPANSTEVAAQTYFRLPAYFDYILSAWVKGQFVGDYDSEFTQPDTLDDVDLQKQPEILDRAAMHFCLADAMHPGCELTWPMRHASMYRAPYRLRMRAHGVAEPSYGSTLTQADVLRVNGPLYDQGPGDLTRWMAIPWQGDTAYCRSGYDMEYDPYLPTFWPARVPNQVLTLADYETLCDEKRPMPVRVASFYNRPSWLRQLPAQSSAPDQMMYVIQHFGEMGILEAKPRPADMAWLPEFLYVENLTAVKQAEMRVAHQLFAERYPELGPHDRLLAEAGWFSEEQRNEFLTIKMRGN
ncbi:MAG: LodA/GoxA family CTQ-dependent oxidase [Nitrospira sp.]|nr:LodA/GoxA family CTQ-dependent oxidase [Nitrospira sp.]MDH4242686.1 LodA/GoxA family CTQ-dependent oxidase [Nitrospira sp.]MDH4355045.1 LodA/GoxA family CTQ-dependent oxidase [Nitrospira sp.]MDH5316969.1 LodA/GoxA family CTQ-dependent oxidase [Nitrospira sp.]